MRKINRVWAALAIAAVAVAGPVATAGAASAETAPAPVSSKAGHDVDLNKLRTKVREHEYKAEKYERAADREASKQHPSRKKYEHDKKMARAHERKAQEYRAIIKRYEDSEGHV